MIKKDNGSVLVVIFFTERCNLDCKYCYVKQSQRTMSWNVAKQSVDFISNLNYEDTTLCFMGGEPLVEWELVKNMTKYAQSKEINKFNLCTNMVLIDQKKIEYFKANNFNIMLSIDGILEAHDIERKDHKGSGSFSEVNKAVSLISTNRNKIKFTIQMCLSPFNVKYLSASFNFLINKGLANTKIYLIPIVDPNYIWKKVDFQHFKNETSKLLEIYDGNKNGLERCKLIFGKCCSPYGASELKKTKNLKKELCLHKDRYYGIDIIGDVYYCFFAGFSKYKELCKDYKLGDVWKGIVHKEKLNDFTGEGTQRCMSCLAWNYIVTKDVRKPADVYLKLYNIWIGDN